MIRLQFSKTARALRVQRSGPLISLSQITFATNNMQKREGSEAPGSAKRAKAENGDASKPSPASNKKETVPVPDLEECGFDEEHLPQVRFFFRTVDNSLSIPTYCIAYSEYLN